MKDAVFIRSLIAADRPALLDILMQTPVFNESEVAVALELIDIALGQPEQQDYYFSVAELNDKPCGYYCVGRRPLTDAVFDLYWIVVDPAICGKGIGSSLLFHAEQFVANLQARWLLAETSSRDLYKKTRDFYELNHYQLVAHIPDFYSLDDGLMIFGKKF